MVSLESRQDEDEFVLPRVEYPVFRPEEVLDPAAGLVEDPFAHAGLEGFPDCAVVLSQLDYEEGEACAAFVAAAPVDELLELEFEPEVGRQPRKGVEGELPFEGCDLLLELPVLRPDARVFLGESLQLRFLTEAGKGFHVRCTPFSHSYRGISALSKAWTDYATE